MNLEWEKRDVLHNAIEIGAAKTIEEKSEIYRLRYHIYGEEIPYKLVSVDHLNKLLYDELDDWGILFYAKMGGELVGTVRVNIGTLEDFPSDIAEAFYMRRFKKFYREEEEYHFAFASKGMVAASHRKFPVFTMLMSKVFELYCDCQIQFGFGNSNFHLLPLHEHYGHRRIGKNIVEPNLGLMASFVTMPDDICHLQRVGSPFLKVALQKNKTHDSRVYEWFASEFPETQYIINSQLISEDELEEILHSRLGISPNLGIPILGGLSQAEAKKFLHSCGVMVQCPKGDYIVSNKDASQELNILLSGTLYSPEEPTMIKLMPGQSFGTNGLIERGTHTLNVLAAEDTEIVVLSYHFFLKFRQQFPEIAAKIMRNLS